MRVPHSKEPQLYALALAALKAPGFRKVLTIGTLSRGVTVRGPAGGAAVVTGEDAVSLDLGFETIGNATLIVHDGAPVLATDPWLAGDAYFGSWCMTHVVPDEQLEAVRAAPFLWISHGHPDHLSMASLAQLGDKQLLLPDHVGNRIRDALVKDGYRVQVMPDREWMQLSPRVRILSIADFNQDAVLLVDIDGTLVINANDASDRGWAYTVRRYARRKDPAFLLALSGYGDADMINFFDESGNRIPPYAARKLPPGPAIKRRLDQFGARYFIPFASMHQYQRADSVWANEYTTPIADHGLGFESTTSEILPAFTRYDCRRDDATTIDPPENPIVVREPAEFGDDWSEPLSDDDAQTITHYLQRVATLRGRLDEVVFRVGGEERRVPIGSGANRSVTFEVPRRSLVDAARWEIFDDLLIGNYMRTTLHGDWTPSTFGGEFSAPLAKYSDNGRAHTPEQLRHYFAEYRRRAFVDSVRWELTARGERVVVDAARKARARVAPGSTAHRIGSKTYRKLRAR
jgi:hypothetical protein